MYRRLYPWMFLLGGVLIGLVASGRIVLHAQDRGKVASPEPVAPPIGVTTEKTTKAGFEDGVDDAAPDGLEPARAARSSVQDVLVRPYHFPFKRPTSLAQVCLHLKQTLGVPVVLDVAAMGRQDVVPDDTVHLDLDNVRLKTGLKLLLDQVGLTYHVVPDDNLLIITDQEGTDDPMDRIWSELRTLHRDLHDVQDAVDELGDALFGDEEAGPRVRKPTIIEEKPDQDPQAPVPLEGEIKGPKDQAPNPGNSRSPAKPGHAPPAKSPRGNRPNPSRVPL